MRAVDCGRSKSVKAGRAYVCFLEREVYAFLSGFAAQCCGPAFFVCGRAAEGDVRGRRQTGRGWRHVRDRGQSNAGGATRESCAGKREDRCFSFSREKIRRCFLYLLGSDNSRSAATAVLGRRRRRENGACAGCGSVWSTGGNPACGGLWPFQLIQLIDLRYLCESAEREKRMGVCFLLTLYI